MKVYNYNSAAPFNEENGLIATLEEMLDGSGIRQPYSKRKLFTLTTNAEGNTLLVQAMREAEDSIPFGDYSQFQGVDIKVIGENSRIATPRFQLVYDWIIATTIAAGWILRGDDEFVFSQHERYKFYKDSILNHSTSAHQTSVEDLERMRERMQRPYIGGPGLDAFKNNTTATEALECATGMSSAIRGVPSPLQVRITENESTSKFVDFMNATAPLLEKTPVFDLDKASEDFKRIIEANGGSSVVPITKIESIQPIEFGGISPEQKKLHDAIRSGKISFGSEIEDVLPLLDDETADEKKPDRYAVRKLGDAYAKVSSIKKPVSKVTAYLLVCGATAVITSLIGYAFKYFVSYEDLVAWLNNMFT